MSSLSKISLLAMLCVIWWHCYCGSGLERWFIPSFCVWSVPWFFFLSGVLFRKTLDTKSIGYVVLAKVKSLVVPYILWCVIGCAITVCISDGGGGGGVFDAFCVSRIRIHPWGNAALWYVRSLFIFMLITGSMHYSFSMTPKFARVLAMPLMSIVLIAVCSQRLLNLGPGSSAFYFVLGYVMSAYILKGESANRMLFGILGIVLAIASRLIWFALGYDFVHNGLTWLGNLSSVGIIISMVCLIEYVPTKVSSSRIVQSCATLTAFVYFMHYPLNDLIKHCAKHIDSNLLFLILVVTAPLLYLSIAYWVKNHANRVYNVLSGGR